MIDYDRVIQQIRTILPTTFKAVAGGVSIESFSVTTNTDLPAAKTLLTLPALTSTAVTGPERSEPDPTAAHVALENVNCATLAAVLSERAIEPEAMRYAWLLCKNMA